MRTEPNKSSVPPYPATLSFNRIQLRFRQWGEGRQRFQEHGVPREVICAAIWVVRVVRVQEWTGRGIEVLGGLAIRWCPDSPEALSDIEVIEASDFFEDGAWGDYF